MPLQKAGNLSSCSYDGACIIFFGCTKILSESTLEFSISASK